MKFMKVKTLRSYITLTVSLTVAIALICSGLFFYSKTAGVLTDNYKQLVIQQLNQTNRQVSEQLNLIDSLPPLFLSNTLIREALDPASEQQKPPYLEEKLAVEKQMSYLLINNYLWNKKLIDAVYIFDGSLNAYGVTPDGNRTAPETENKKIIADIDRSDPNLIIRTPEEGGHSLCFIRNIFSVYTGMPIATILISVNQRTWTQYYSENLNQGFHLFMYSGDRNLLSSQDAPMSITDLPGLSPGGGESLQEIQIKGHDYYVASQKTDTLGIISTVAAPKSLILKELNQTLTIYLLILSLVVVCALFLSVILSRAITRPVEKMIYYVQRISQGHKEKMPPLEMYSEFNEFAGAFNHMLEQLDLYYEDNLEKQLLLKNAEIQALQSQMDPHFLLNVLNTIAWKAQMTDNEEIYQMVISLGELLKMNTVSKTTSFIPLKDELRYVRFYIYLQKMRFEDKISADIQAEPSLYEYLIPCFCIQPLVENAIVHGLEPKKGAGRLIINIIPTEDYMEISVIDNGIGFEAPPDLWQVRSSLDDSHTHIGLRNLDRRLFLLFGESARLSISSTPNQCTTISFKMPYRTEPF